MGEVARLADGFVQQLSDLCGCRRSSRVGVHGKVPRQSGAESGNARQRLAQAVVQLAAEVFLFAASDLGYLAFRQIQPEGSPERDVHLAKSQHVSTSKT